MTGNRLLIVDDEPAIGAFVGRVAANVGYEILALSTADKFLEQVSRWEDNPAYGPGDLPIPFLR